MTDSTLNRFISSGTNAERLAFTPTPPTPASGPDVMYIWLENDTGDFYGWDPVNASWTQLNVPGTPASTTEVLTGTDTSKYVTADALAALWEKGADEASGATVALGEGGFFHVTGTTTITDIDFDTDKSGRSAILVFDGILTLTHNATTLILPTGANITTAAGDCCLVVSEGTDNVRVVWYMRKDGTPLVSGTGALTLITETVTSGSAADVTFSSIPGTYRDLEIRIRGRGTNASTDVSVRLQFNGDTGNNYHSMIGVMTSSGFSGASSMTQASITRLFDIPAASATANYSGTGTIVIGDYRGTTFFKSVHGQNGFARGTAATDALSEIGSGIWLSTSAITSVRVFLSAGNLVDNTVVSLYGRM